MVRRLNNSNLFLSQITNENYINRVILMIPNAIGELNKIAPPHPHLISLAETQQTSTCLNIGRKEMNFYLFK